MRLLPNRLSRSNRGDPALGQHRGFLLTAARISSSFFRSCVLLTLAALFGWAFVSRAQKAPAPQPLSAATPVAQADASCARCHASIVNSYLKTPKANASGLATDNLIPGSWTQPSSGIQYKVEKTGDTAWLRYSNPANSRQNGGHPLQYFLGSGHLGVTYLYSTAGYLMESPVAYYTSASGYDMKPGLSGVQEIAPAIPMEPGCLRCHMSGTQRTDAGSINHYSGLPFLHGGITCENCHGDASEHVRSGGKAAVLNPIKLAPRLRDSICISCHLEGDIAIDKNGHSPLDYKPGEDISTYRSFFVYGNANPEARGVSEVEQFASSHCKRASGDKMSCTTCHDPHFTPAPAERAAFYRGKCLACHNTPTFVKTHHPDNPDCVSCHMPRATAENIPHVAWTDHRILAHPSETAPGATDYTKLLPVSSPEATPRDHAMALYSAVMDGHREDGTEAYAQLSSAFANDAHDVDVLNALGTLANMKGDTARSTSLFEQVLAIDPSDRIASVNLAVLRARAGNLQGARTLLKAVFARNEDDSATAANLAAIACMQGDGEAARSTLELALQFSPGSRDLQRRLSEASTCRATIQP